MRNSLAVVGFALLAFVMSACASALTPTPTAPMTPPAPTRVTFATLTPSPTATFTPLPPASTLPPSTPGSLISAMNKTKASVRYRVTMTLNARQGETPQISLDLKGAVNGDDAHYNYQLGNEQIEFIAARGQFFAKGARSLGLPTTTKWYILTPDLADAARPPFSPEDVLTSFLAQVPKETFQPFAREALDALTCQVWRYIPKTLGETGISNALGSDQENSAFGALDQAEIKLWLCDDGALHQLSVEIAAHNPRRATEKGSANLLLHIWDFQNASIGIDPPANAEKFQLAAPTP